MKLCSCTNFGAFFSTVDIDFRFLAYFKIFEIAKFVYCYSVTDISNIFTQTSIAADWSVLLA